jgi:1,4-alpha-glucan branching enzyme
VITTERLADLAAGREGDPFAVLGPHAFGDGTIVRAFAPDATAVALLDAGGN